MLAKLRHFNFRTFVSNYFKLLGVLWLLFEVLLFFFNDLPLQRADIFFFVIPLVVAVFTAWPKKRYSFKLNRRDVNIDIVLGDIFESKDAVVIPINNKLDADLNGNVMRSESIKKQYIEKYLGADPTKLQVKVDEALAARPDYYQAMVASTDTYQFGTVVPVRGKAGLTYFVVNSIRKKNYRVESNSEIIAETLPQLWSYLAEEADKHDTIAIPLIGTGEAKLRRTREDVFQMVIDTIIEATKQKVFANRFEIYIRWEDVKKYDISVQDLVDYLKFKVKYARI